MLVILHQAQQNLQDKSSEFASRDPKNLVKRILKDNIFINPNSPDSKGKLLDFEGFLLFSNNASKGVRVKRTKNNDEIQMSETV